MEDHSSDKNITILKYGLIYGVLRIIFTLLTHYAGLMQNVGFSYLSFALIVICMVFGLREYKLKKNNGFLQFGAGVHIGFLIVLLGGMINSVFTYILYVFIDPAKFKEIITLSQEQLLQNGGISDSQMDQLLDMMSKFMTPFSFFISGVIGVAFTGIILALIISAIMKKNPENEF